MKDKQEYSDYTYNSKNPLARFSHRTRFKIAVRMVLSREFNSILDFGSGDNKFLNELFNIKKNIQLNAFEPVMEVPKHDKIKTYTRLEDLDNKKFDVITCFETLEHFNKETQDKMIKGFTTKLNNNGRVIISVPIEVGFPSLVKNSRRFIGGNTNFTYIKNSIKCFFEKDVPEVRELKGYIFSHIGFNHKKLEELLLKEFKIIKKETSPFKKLSYQFNSQIFYILEKNEKI